MHCLAYNDSTNIVHLYTEEFGRASFLVSNSQSKKSKLKRAYFIPLSIIEIESEFKGSRQLQRIKEVRSLYPFMHLPFDNSKSAVAMFLSEVLYRALRDNESNKALFEYLFNSVQLLDLCEKGLANFHLVFLIKLSRYMGFYPNLEGGKPGWYFDLSGGVFVQERPLHNAWLSPKDSEGFARLMQISFDNMHFYMFDHNQRVELLRQILNYYRIHLTDFPAIKSLDVFQDLFS